MFEQIRKHSREIGTEIPSYDESVEYIKSSSKPSVTKLLKEAADNNSILLQPRCGVGDHDAMKTLHRVIHSRAKPDILSLTIDSHTRLLRLKEAREVVAKNPANLNGYPLIAHGWKKGREINEASPVPIEIRHGSPDPRLLFDYSIASGFTSFEGGPIGYNIPYCRDVKISESWAYWQEVEEMCGELANSGVPIDREIFGTLTGVLMPPSVSIAISLLEAINASINGVSTLSIAIPQCGNPLQDIAALKALKSTINKFLPDSSEVYMVLHQFMGVFPNQRDNAEALILLGSLAAKRGGANKIITKTYEESLGVPTGYANSDGLNLTRAGSNSMLQFIDFDESRIDSEAALITTEVDAILEPVLQPNHLGDAVSRGFTNGSLDVPFSASKAAKSDVIPIRDSEGFIRFHSYGKLPVSQQSKSANSKSIKQADVSGIQESKSLYKKVRDSVLYFQEAA